MNPPEESYLREYNRLYKRYDSVWHELAVALDLSDSALSILYRILEEGGGCLQRDLCDSISLTKQTVHSSVRKLQEQGLLTLERGKGRDLRIRLTPLGQKLTREKIAPLIELENSVFRELGPEDSRLLLCLTARYLAVFEARSRQHIQAITKTSLPGETRAGRRKDPDRYDHPAF